VQTPPRCGRFNSGRLSSPFPCAVPLAPIKRVRRPDSESHPCRPATFCWPMSERELSFLATSTTDRTACILLSARGFPCPPLSSLFEVCHSRAAPHYCVCLLTSRCCSPLPHLGFPAGRTCPLSTVRRMYSPYFSAATLPEWDVVFVHGFLADDCLLGCACPYPLLFTSLFGRGKFSYPFLERQSLPPRPPTLPSLRSRALTVFLIPLSCFRGLGRLSPPFHSNP